ncbi:DUF167 domain-containing protein [Candidatus Woesearchaeota archaeon]|nr:DUF167 domain-containing protein [Candidatus Woesearchaeota archaeon]
MNGSQHNEVSALRSLLTSGKFSVRVKPNAKETALVGVKDGTYVISIAAKPEGNKANIALLKFLKKQLGKQVRLVSGATSRDKLIEIL